MLLQLPLGAEHLGADLALLRVLRVVDLQVQAQGAQLLERLGALGAVEHALSSRVNLRTDEHLSAATQAGEITLRVGRMLGECQELQNALLVAGRFSTRKKGEKVRWTRLCFRTPLKSENSPMSVRRGKGKT